MNTRLLSVVACFIGAVFVLLGLYIAATADLVEGLAGAAMGAAAIVTGISVWR